MPPVVSAANLTKTYTVAVKQSGFWGAVRGLWRPEKRAVDAVRGIDLHIERGEFVAFLGPNGAGKTTTLKLLSGIITPSAGTAQVLGHVPWLRENPFRRRFALVMGQKNQLWWDLAAQESFRLHQEIYNIPPVDYQRNLDELVELLGVGKLLTRPVRELSLGERMKMELIASLLHSPEVLFLDEPTIGLDVVAQHNIQQFLKRYQQERGITILLTSHYMKDIAALCRRVIIIAQGKIIHDGSLADIVETFSGHKLVTLELAEEPATARLAEYGEVQELRMPMARLKIPRDEVPARLAKLLSELRVADVSVEDPPLEDVIALVFAQAEAEGG
ncbi:MAG: ATP-binding cassette domain-containing protein [Pirellulales bacterium]|nr:ATP-binding cassette domain-containing protein [Pirellulales bacterium]